MIFKNYYSLNFYSGLTSFLKAQNISYFKFHIPVCASINFQTKIQNSQFTFKTSKTIFTHNQFVISVSNLNLFSNSSFSIFSSTLIDFFSELFSRLKLFQISNVQLLLTLTSVGKYPHDQFCYCNVCFSWFFLSLSNSCVLCLSFDVNSIILVFAEDRNLFISDFISLRNSCLISVSFVLRIMISSSN